MLESTLSASGVWTFLWERRLQVPGQGYWASASPLRLFGLVCDVKDRRGNRYAFERSARMKGPAYEPASDQRRLRAESVDSETIYQRRREYLTSPLLAR